MTSRNKYINPVTKRAKEMRDRQKTTDKNKPLTQDNVFNSLIVVSEQISNSLPPVGYYDNNSNSETIPIAENYNKNNNLIDNAIAYDKSKKPLLSYLFTPKATPIKENKEVVALTQVYKSNNFNAGKSKKKPKNKKVKKNRKNRKTIKLKKRH
jgi:hypothetical protein